MKPKAHISEDRMPVASSMVAASKMTGMPVALIKSLKNSGCKAFDSANRVNIGVLLKFFFETYDDGNERPPDGLMTWREALNRVQTKREEIKLATEKDEVMPWEEAIRRLQNLQSTYWLGLKQIFAELPSELEHLDRTKIKTILDNRGAAHREKMIKASQ